jgi:hypothetical protein
MDHCMCRVAPWLMATSDIDLRLWASYLCSLFHTEPDAPRVGSRREGGMCVWASEGESMFASAVGAPPETPCLNAASCEDVDATVDYGGRLRSRARPEQVMEINGPGAAGQYCLRRAVA